MQYQTPLLCYRPPYAVTLLMAGRPIVSYYRRQR